MIPIRIQNATHLFQAPENYDAEKYGACVALALRIEDGVKYMSAWEPTPDELAAIVAGAPIIVTILGSQPPIMLSVQSVETAPAGPEGASNGS